MLKSILTYHVVQGQLSPGKVDGSHATLQGASATVNGQGNSPQGQQRGCGLRRSAHRERDGVHDRHRADAAYVGADSSPAQHVHTVTRAGSVTDRGAVTDPGPLRRRGAGCARISEHPQSAFDPNPEEFAVASTEVEHFDGVDPAEVPSAAFGWSKINYRTWHVVGLFAFGFLLAMLRGNHVGHVEDCS